MGWLRDVEGREERRVLGLGWFDGIGKGDGDRGSGSVGLEDNVCVRWFAKKV